VIGGGWAGLAAAVEATLRGHGVTLFEMAPQLGGRARSLASDDGRLDNGQHILIGAYVETLRLMRVVGADPEQAFRRSPLTLVGADGKGLRMGAGPAALAFAWATLRRSDWSLAARCSLLAAAGRWAAGRFRCRPGLTVDELTARLPATVRIELIEPLCVAALNTPAAAASASVFLRVLHDALLSGPGSSDLLLPKRPLSELMPEPAERWLASRSATIHRSSRVQALTCRGSGWQVDGVGFDRVVIASSASEAARLVVPHDAAWAAMADALRYEPIVTVYAQSDGARLAEPMLALRSDDSEQPVQFVFDQGALGGPPGRLAFVISGAARWVERGSDATLHATLAQARDQLRGQLGREPVLIRLLTEKRATFRCIPGLQRPRSAIRPGLFAVGDYVDGPYPATLEGAVRSGVAAVRAMA
jgi:squalene-associated FAD-dependent desaturase